MKKIVIIFFVVLFVGSIVENTQAENNGALVKCLADVLELERVCVSMKYPSDMCKKLSIAKNKKCRDDFESRINSEDKKTSKKSKMISVTGRETKEVEGRANAEMDTTRERVDSLIRERKAKWNYYLDKVCKDKLGSQWSAVAGTVQLLDTYIYKPDRSTKEEGWCKWYEFCGKAVVKGLCIKK